MNSFGRLFRISIFGESHGNSLGIVVDGVRPGLDLTPECFEADLSRRRSGRIGTTPRQELDLPSIVSGTFKGKTTGAPVTVLFKNKNTKSKDYEKLIEQPRPGHADFVAIKKYGGFNDYTGGGHFSGRLTLGIVAAGVIAKKMISPISISTRILEIGGSQDIDAVVQKAVDTLDSVGGIIECRATNMPIGLGEPFFESVESMLAHMVFSIPATKGIEFGSGFAAARMKGSEHNDAIVSADGKTKTNHAGGINGGITNGNDIIYRVAIKPTSSISSLQHTLNLRTNLVDELRIEGRHDACIALRAPVVLEAGTAVVLADLQQISKMYKY